MDELKLVEDEVVSIYEKEGGEKLINARELFIFFKRRSNKNKICRLDKE